MLFKSNSVHYNKNILEKMSEYVICRILTPTHILPTYTTWFGLLGLQMVTDYSLSRKRKHLQANSVQVCISGERIPIQKSVKYLGVVIDDELKWSQQVEAVRTRA